MTETVTIDLPIEECYSGGFTESPDIPAPEDRDETDEMVISMTKDIKKSEFLRERAEERLNEDDLPQATALLWIDKAEVYSLCDDHYHEKRKGAWTDGNWVAR